MNRLLLIVDPQVDFICGALPVPGAEAAMNRLAAYIRENDGKYAHKIITADRHPYDHCSFAACGGPWPRHCVGDTVGAAIWQAVFDALHQTEGEVTVLHKGQNPCVEEYSIFKNREGADAIGRLIEELRIGEIDICGLAGDVCVADTLKDGMAIYGRRMFHLLAEFSPKISVD